MADAWPPGGLFETFLPAPLPLRALAVPVAPALLRVAHAATGTVATEIPLLVLEPPEHGLEVGLAPPGESAGLGSAHSNDAVTVKPAAGSAWTRHGETSTETPASLMPAG